MSRGVKILCVFVFIILGYAMMVFGYTDKLPNWLGESLFFGGAIVVLCSGMYGLIKLIGVIKGGLKS
jgi:hypothetical protein